MPFTSPTAPIYNLKIKNMPSNYHQLRSPTPFTFHTPFLHPKSTFTPIFLIHYPSTSAGTCKKFMLEASTITSSPSSGSSGGRSSGSVGPNGSSKGGTKSNLAGDPAGCGLPFFFQEEAAPKNCTLQGINKHISHQTEKRTSSQKCLGRNCHISLSFRKRLLSNESSLHKKTTTTNFPAKDFPVWCIYHGLPHFVEYKIKKQSSSGCKKSTRKGSRVSTPAIQPAGDESTSDCVLSCSQDVHLAMARTSAKFWGQVGGESRRVSAIGFIQTSPVSGDAYFRDLGGGFLTNPSETYAEVKLEIFYPHFFWVKVTNIWEPPPSETSRA